MINGTLFVPNLCPHFQPRGLAEVFVHHHECSFSLRFLVSNFRKPACLAINPNFDSSRFAVSRTGSSSSSCEGGGHEVETTLDDRTVGAATEHLVEWVGRSDEDTWEPWGDVDAPELVQHHLTCQKSQSLERIPMELSSANLRLRIEKSRKWLREERPRGKTEQGRVAKGRFGAEEGVGTDSPDDESSAMSTDEVGSSSSAGAGSNERDDEREGEDGVRKRPCPRPRRTPSSSSSSSSSDSDVTADDLAGDEDAANARDGCGDGGANGKVGDEGDGGASGAGKSVAPAVRKRPRPSGPPATATGRAAPKAGTATKAATSAPAGSRKSRRRVPPATAAGPAGQKAKTAKLAAKSSSKSASAGEAGQEKPLPTAGAGGLQGKDGKVDAAGASASVLNPHVRTCVVEQNGKWSRFVDRGGVGAGGRARRQRKAGDHALSLSLPPPLLLRLRSSQPTTKDRRSRRSPLPLSDALFLFPSPTAHSLPSVTCAAVPTTTSSTTGQATGATRWVPALAVAATVAVVVAVSVDVVAFDVAVAVVLA